MLALGITTQKWMEEDRVPYGDCVLCKPWNKFCEMMRNLYAVSVYDI